MKNLTYFFAALILNLSLFSCAVEEDSTASIDYNTEHIIVEYNQIDYEIVELINAYRISIDLNPLNILNEASKEAIVHNQYMIDQGTPSHDYFHQRSQNLINSVDAKSVSENIGYGFSGAESVVLAWLNSNGHKQNIEDPDVTDVGISTKQDENGKNYFTNIFVKL